MLKKVAEYFRPTNFKTILKVKLKILVK